MFAPIWLLKLRFFIARNVFEAKQGTPQSLAHASGYEIPPRKRESELQKIWLGVVTEKGRLGPCFDTDVAERR